jgi:hypothetical protein
LLTRYWGSGFLPTNHQGVEFRSGAEPILFVNNPQGISPEIRRRLIDGTREINREHLQAVGDPEIATRIASFEMAYRMQTSVPELMDISKENRATLEMYGAEPGKSSYANNCLLARRLAERGVRFIQLYHRGWDHHNNLPADIAKTAKAVDQASAALVRDLRQRGLLDDTLVVWGGEFGRTPMNQGDSSNGNYGRDHHMKAFSLWMAGGGIRGGTTYGSTDDFGYNTAENPVHANDFQATVLHLLGIEHTRFTHRFQGRDYRLTDIGGEVVRLSRIEYQQCLGWIDGHEEPATLPPKPRHGLAGCDVSRNLARVRHWHSRRFGLAVGVVRGRGAAPHGRGCAHGGEAHGALPAADPPARSQWPTPELGHRGESRRRRHGAVAR